MDSSTPIPDRTVEVPLQQVDSKIQAMSAIKNEPKVQPLNGHPELHATPAYAVHDDRIKDEYTEAEDQDTSMAKLIRAPVAERSSLSFTIQKVIDEGSPEHLEAEVKKYKKFLSVLKKPLLEIGSKDQDAGHFLRNLGLLLEQKTDTPTIIGVVGNTGAGKSSVINALLDEERLVPTNCMRACTAVVTEMSYNDSTDPNARYRGEIEFIKSSDWEKELNVSLSELLDDRGQISRECQNPASEAGIAYAKVKAVYPQYDKHMLAKATISELMDDPDVKIVLGSTAKLQHTRPRPFYKDLQQFVDSKEKATKKKGKGSIQEKSHMGFWPLIKVVRIYIKADALSTGAVIVDLPGVQDSNAARAAVAASYLKQCTGLWIVAPINRAVDDKVAKSLLGDSFKRQLQFDGKFNRITFICSKTDEISIMEASDSLSLEEETSADWAKLDGVAKDIKYCENFLEEFKASKDILLKMKNNTDSEIEIWNTLMIDFKKGKAVFAPFKKSIIKKRQRSGKCKQSENKSKRLKFTSDEVFLVNDEDEDQELVENDKSDSESDSESNDSDTEISGKDQDTPALTEKEIDEQLTILKEYKMCSIAEELELDGKARIVEAKIKALQAEHIKIKTCITAVCIQGRNDYSRGAIQLDFAAGIKELDQETAMEDDEDNFDPAEDKRDYDEVAQSLPVFCCSSRVYQQMSGRLKRDSAVPGFRTIEETEIPQLQSHCKSLTENVRISNCRRFLTDTQQFLNSVSMWSLIDGTSHEIPDTQRQIVDKHLQISLIQLDKSLDAAVKGCLEEMTKTLSKNIFENIDGGVQAAMEKAVPKAQSWGQYKQEGGFHWGTYQALVKRHGVFTNSSGVHNLNEQLCKPMIRHLASHWEKAFTRRLPNVLKIFQQKSKGFLTSFHTEVRAHCLTQGTGAASLVMLGQQLHTYEAIFADLATQIMDLISALQRDVNREFVPVVAMRLNRAYDTSAGESGSGMYIRMKGHMEEGVASNLDMFSDSCNQVKQRLTAMCRDVNDAMSIKVEEVFTNMSRDYNRAISGRAVPEQMMPKEERLMRAAVAKALYNLELANQAEALNVEMASTEVIDLQAVSQAAGPNVEINSAETTES